MLAFAIVFRSVPPCHSCALSILFTYVLVVIDFFRSICSETKVPLPPFLHAHCHKSVKFKLSLPSSIPRSLHLPISEVKVLPCLSGGIIFLFRSDLRTVEQHAADVSGTNGTWQIAWEKALLVYVVVIPWYKQFSGLFTLTEPWKYGKCNSPRSGSRWLCAHFAWHSTQFTRCDFFPRSRGIWCACISTFSNSFALVKRSYSLFMVNNRWIASEPSSNTYVLCLRPWLPLCRICFSSYGSRVILFSAKAEYIHTYIGVFE